MTKARKIACWIAGALVALTIVGVIVAGVLLAPLDREVVIHWDLTGQPNGWGPAWTYLILIGTSGLLLAVIALVFALIPGPADREIVDPDPIVLAPGEVAAWSRIVLSSRGYRWTMAVGIVATLAGAFAAMSLTSGAAWPALFVPVLLLIVLGLSAGWRVSAGPTGLTVRGLAGLPIMRVRTSDIVQAVAIGVHPLRDFGGWGIRGAIGRGGHWRTGVVARAGDAIQVTRRNGRAFVVTVDDAATAAAVLNAYAHVPAPPLPSDRPPLPS
jgi:hypothetical protein